MDGPTLVWFNTRFNAILSYVIHLGNQHKEKTPDTVKGSSPQQCLSKGIKEDVRDAKSEEKGNSSSEEMETHSGISKFFVREDSVVDTRGNSGPVVNSRQPESGDKPDEPHPQHLELHPNSISKTSMKTEIWNSMIEIRILLEYICVHVVSNHVLMLPRGRRTEKRIDVHKNTRNELILGKREVRGIVERVHKRNPPHGRHHEEGPPFSRPIIFVRAVHCECGPGKVGDQQVSWTHGVNLILAHVLTDQFTEFLLEGIFWSVHVPVKHAHVVLEVLGRHSELLQDVARGIREGVVRLEEFSGVTTTCHHQGTEATWVSRHKIREVVGDPVDVPEFRIEDVSFSGSSLS